MSKIAIISQAEQGVLIDISGCSSLTEAKHYLTSTLQVSSQFWDGLVVDLNLGPLVLNPEEVKEIQAIVSEVGVQPRQIFSHSPITRESLVQCRLPIGITTRLQDYAAAGSVSGQCGSFEKFNPELSADAGIAVAGLQEVLSCGDDGASKSEFAPGLLLECESSSNIDGIRKQSGLVEAFQRARADLSEGNQSCARVPEILSSSACSSVEPESSGVLPNAPLSAARPQTPGVLMMKQTLRSGQMVSHKGHLVIIGDVNPGAELIADGDITVWGSLRGMAHAGAGGNTNAEIRALKFDPIQLRIAQAIARSPDRSKAGGKDKLPSGPETARVVDGKIRISGAEPE